MIKIVQFIFLLLISQANLFGCSLCRLDVPNLHINITLTPKANTTHFEISWFFDKKFIATLKQYDLNKNNTFDTDEQNQIKKDLLEYVSSFNYLTQIAYIQKEYKIKEADLQKINNPTTHLKFENNTMEFDYSFDLPIIPKKGYKISILFSDLGNNFNFILRDVILKEYNGTKNIQIQTSKAEIIFDDFIPNKNQINIQKVVEKNQTPLEKLALLLENYKTKIKDLITNIKETNSPLAYSWLLFFSFLYGVLHAIGPGHGKSLVSAYFLSGDHSIKKALSISFLIGMVHTFSAFLLTLFIYFVLNILFANIFADIEAVATKISGGIIILVASYLLFKKLNQKKKMTFSLNKPIHQNHSSCGCGSCTTNSTDLGVILGAGIVPCAGTVTIFLFTMGLGVYFIGFLSAVFMGFGMSLVIFLTAYLTKNIKTIGGTNGKFVKFFEYGSLVFILLLGISLIF